MQIVIQWQASVDVHQAEQGQSVNKVEITFLSFNFFFKTWLLRVDYTENKHKNKHKPTFRKNKHVFHKDQVNFGLIEKHDALQNKPNWPKS